MLKYSYVEQGWQEKVKEEVFMNLWIEFKGFNLP